MGKCRVGLDFTGTDWIVKNYVQNGGWLEEAEKKEGLVMSSERSFQTMHYEGWIGSVSCWLLRILSKPTGCGAKVEVLFAVLLNLSTWAEIRKKSHF